MENFEINEVKIANYLDGKMNDAEQKAFMQELGENEDLRRQFEDELLMEDLLGGDMKGAAEEDLFFQSADGHIAMLEKTLEKNKQGAKEATITPITTGDAQEEAELKAPVVPFLKKYRVVAAAAVGIICVALVFILARRNSGGTSLVAKTNVNDSPANAQAIKTRDTAKRNNGKDDAVALLLPVHEVNGDSIYRQYITKYKAGADDPVQVNRVLNDYQSGHYNEVIEATEASLRQAGLSDEEDIAIQYLHLYKGLSYLNLNRPKQAIAEFGTVLKTADKMAYVYYTAEWYSALAFLKAKDINNAAGIAKRIAKSASPYKTKAADLLKQLN